MSLLVEQMYNDNDIMNKIHEYHQIIKNKEKYDNIVNDLNYVFNYCNNEMIIDIKEKAENIIQYKHRNASLRTINRMSKIYTRLYKKLPFIDKLLRVVAYESCKWDNIYRVDIIGPRKRHNFKNLFPSLRNGLWLIYSSRLNQNINVYNSYNNYSKLIHNKDLVEKWNLKQELYLFNNKIIYYSSQTIKRSIQNYNDFYQSHNDNSLITINKMIKSCAGINGWEND